jgi:uncharacterized protein YecT (DUF1311 family)
MEPCAGRALLNLDARFNARAAALWSILDASGKRALLKAQTEWLTYRTQACAVQSRAFLGGTAAPVTFGHVLFLPSSHGYVIAEVDAVAPSVGSQ